MAQHGLMIHRLNYDAENEQLGRAKSPTNPMDSTGGISALRDRESSAEKRDRFQTASITTPGRSTSQGEITNRPPWVP